MQCSDLPFQGYFYRFTHTDQVMYHDSVVLLRVSIPTVEYLEKVHASLQKVLLKPTTTHACLFIALALNF